MGLLRLGFVVWICLGFWGLGWSEDRGEGDVFLGDVFFDPLTLYEGVSVHGGGDHFLDGVEHQGRKAREDWGIRTGVLQGVSVGNLLGIESLSGRMSVRAEERAKVWSEGGGEQNPRVSLREFYGSYETEAGHSVELGRVLLPWSEGLAFRVLDVWERGGLRGGDIEDVYGDEEGRVSLVFRYLGEGWSLEAVAGGEGEGEVSTEARERGDYEEAWYHGLRWLGRVGEVDTSLVLHGGARRRLGVGGSFFYGLNENLSFRGEGFVREGMLRLMDGRVIGKLGDRLVEKNPVRTWEESSSTLYPRFALGFQWTGRLGGEVYHDVVVEYMYDHRGLDDGSWERWKGLVKEHEETVFPSTAEGFAMRGLVLKNLGYDGLTLQGGGGLMRRHYIFGRWKPDFQPWSPSLSALCTWDSCRLGADMSYRTFGSPLEWRWGGRMHVGEGGAFGVLPESYSVEMGFLFYGG